MHILKPAFGMERDAALDFTADRGFGIVVAHDGVRPVASHLPFVVQRDGPSAVVQCHVTRDNPLARLADGQRQFLVVAAGADAYVSNDWYVTPDQVSTWLYQAVHLTGTARCLPRHANRRHGDDLLHKAERPLWPKTPWGLDTMEPGKRAAMLDAITTIEIAVEVVEGQCKLNQHKSDLDQIAVVQSLERFGNPSGQEIARRMRQVRPLLDYDHPNAGAQSLDANVKGSRSS